MTKIIMNLELRESINRLIGTHEDKESILQYLRAFKKRILQPEYAFDIESLLYGGIVTQALDAVSNEEQSVLLTLVNQMNGKMSYGVSYVLQHDFQGLLSDDALAIFHLLRDFVEWYERQISPSENQSVGIGGGDQLYEQLQTLCYNALPPKNISELMVSQASNILLSLPYPPELNFSMLGDTASFSTVYPVDSKEDVRIHIQYVRGLIRKLQGLESLYVDVNSLSSEFAISLR